MHKFPQNLQFPFVLGVSASKWIHQMDIAWLVGFMGNGDLWELIFAHKSEWGFWVIYNIRGLFINPSKSLIDPCAMSKKCIVDIRKKKKRTQLQHLTTLIHIYCDVPGSPCLF